MTDLVNGMKALGLEAGAEVGDGGSTPAMDEDRLHDEVNALLDRIFEIQELRHASTSSGSQNDSESRLSELEMSMATLRPLIESLRNSSSGVWDTLEDWDTLHREYESLKADVRDDGWLARFRTTSDQAEAMMVPLEASMSTCLRYVESITSSPVPVPFESELEELPSIKKLQDLSRSHEAMKLTYIPSITKILRMMDRSLAERPSKNGEALRRYSDMTQRWSTIQRQLQQLDARVRIVMSQHMAASQLPNGDIEVLSDAVSPSSSSAMDYFSRSKQNPNPGEMRKHLPHRSSISSAVSGFSSTSAASMHRKNMGTGPTGQARAPSQSPDVMPKQLPSLRKQPSMMSNMSSSTVRTSERGTPPVPTRPLPDPTMKTPTSIGRFAGAGPRPGAISPSPSAGSSGRQVASRIPMLSPKGGQSPRHLEVPGSGSKQTPANIASGFPDPSSFPRPTYGMYANYGRPNMGARTPSMGSRSVASTVPRASRSAAPPSSFRSMTPTPGGRSSSRLSMGSRAESSYASTPLHPFQPSKYDLLDQSVQSVIDEVGFKLFVARVDQAMKKGQRRAENEEWKGEYVFGAGQKVSPVKLLKIAGRPGRFGMGQGAGRMKCLARVGGAWQDLATILKQRQADAPGPEVDSP